MITVQIGKQRIGRGEPCFIIAEAGVNHNGDVKLAKRLIDAAKDAGADAVKFQTFKTQNVLTRQAAKARYQKETTGANESQYSMIEKLELSDDDFRSLAAHARKRKITFLSSPFDRESVDLLDELGIPAFKIASGEITNFPLLVHIARKGKPVILSTGMATLAEVRAAVQTMKAEGADQLILLHCVSAYPARIQDMNLRAMVTLQKAFRVPVGLSDHTLGILVPIAAAALGAAVIEKHFTLDREMRGPDHRASLDPAGLREMVEAIRRTEAAMGNGRKEPRTEEGDTKKAARRSIVARVDIAGGTVVTEDMVAVKRPGTGLPARDLDKVVGSFARVRIERDEVVTWRKLRRRPV